MSWSKSNTSQKGFTIVEFVVASILLGVSVTGITSMLGSGRDLEHRNKVRHAAYLVAASTMEDTLYHYSTYSSTLITRTPPLDSVTLDSASGYRIRALRQIFVFFLPPEIWTDLPGHDTDTLPSQEVQVNLYWKVDGQTQILTMSKRIAAAQ